MDEPAHHDGAVAHELSALPYESVDAAEGVLVVLVADLLVECLVEQVADRLPFPDPQPRGVHGAQLRHATILATARRRCPAVRVTGAVPTVPAAAYRSGMATWQDVREIALALPEVTETSREGLRRWLVKQKGFAWERPLRRRDLEEMGAAAPTGPVLAAHVADVGVKDALVADNPVVYFTTSHFDGYPAVLIQLALIDKSELKEVLVDGWLARAPKRLARQYLDASG